MARQSRKSTRNEQKKFIRLNESISGKEEGQLYKIDLTSQGRWTKQEHKRFVEALSLFGKNWKKVEEHVNTRSGAQIRSHAQKFFNRLERQFNQQFNGLKSSEIKTMFENKALHNFSFGEKMDTQRRLSADSINTNFSGDDSEKPGQFQPSSQLESQPHMLNVEDLEQLQQIKFINDLLLNQQNIEEAQNPQNNTGYQHPQLLMKSLRENPALNKLCQFVSAYTYCKEDQNNESKQEEKEVDDDALDPVPLKKRYSTDKIGEDESFLHFIIKKYHKYFNIKPITLTDLADLSSKRTVEKSLTSEQQPRSRRGSFVFCNEDEEENETKYQQLKRTRLNDESSNRTNTN